MTSSPSYDSMGNRLSKNATSYSYDRADRILTAESLSDTVNANGNPINRGFDTFANDQADRLTSATVSAVTSTDSYDGGGKRASQTAGSTTTSYIYEVNGSLPNVLTDGTNKYGNPATYYYGRDGHYVVRHDYTGTIVQVSNRHDPGWIDELTNQPVYSR